MPVQGKETMDAATPGNATAVVVVVGGGVCVFFFPPPALTSKEGFH